ncbi:hypothetical protein O0I10_000544 [Lichtheimia ornata]|uniref:Uncharacterized protein n=1 Tax=Lichtheimia ornata TaxID=688661 RepID=A0AAD7Y3W9_9FUNG|nr:uncharacterized protein O0I10_000544 [Lichtheimia ornata]KAJ8663305.1 hypothetical protein O0I10_000544 [Lichtheimia ornata]
MARHCPVFQHEDWEKRYQYWILMRRVIDNLQPTIGYYGEQGQAIEYSDGMRRMDEQQTIGSSSSIMESQMIRAVYIPPRRLQNAIIADAINRRIWMRVCDQTYQQSVGIQDYLSFIEVALTQPEFQCLLCNEKLMMNINKEYRDGLTIPLVRVDSYHCMRCDYNFCKECIDVNTDYDTRHCCCPHCMTLDSLKTNDTLMHVFKAAHIHP